ncbi:hypothetical protein [Sphingomonas sp.]|uniref:hypothetical protein n=1 Tax=Sphingomonas sp. TaxID=28214 RepID=UPI003B3B1335
MIEHELIGRHISEFSEILGYSLAAPGQVAEDDPEYGMDMSIEQPDRGLGLAVDSAGICTAVYFYGAGREAGYQQYAGSLPEGLSFASTRAEVRAALGEPVAHRDTGGFLPPLRHYPWDWFVYDGIKLHFEYDDSLSRVQLVTAMPLPD